MGSPGTSLGSWFWSGGDESRTRKVLPALLLVPGGLTAPASSRDSQPLGLGNQEKDAAQLLSPSEAAGPTSPCRLRPLRPGAAEHTAPFTGKRRAGHGASPPPRGEPRSRRRGGWSPLPPCRPLRANLPGQLSPQRGEARGAGRGVGG